MNETGTSYSARLIWGIKFEKPEYNGDSIEEEDRFNEKWEDIGYKWEEEHGKETGVSILEVSFCYDGIEREGEAAHFMFPTEIGFESLDYGCSGIKISKFDDASMIEKLKKSCKIIGIKFKQPGWHLMTHGS